MTNRRRRKPIKEASIKEQRRFAQRVHKVRKDLTEQTLLGLDDGTTESALNEEICFDKFLDEMDEEQAARDVKTERLQQDAPILEEQKRFREKIAGLKIQYG